MKRTTEIKTFFKGICIGGTMLVPGVSGGSMAMILGIYDKLISSISSFMKHKRQSALFLGVFGIGGILGIFLFANPLLQLIERFPRPMLYFFIGAVVGGIPVITKQAKVEKITWKIILYVALGIATVVLLSFLPTGTVYSNMQAGVGSFLMLGVAGVIAAVALVLPGISVSYMLLMMGLYDETMRAITDLYLPFLLPLGIGLIVGIILTTKFLEYAMRRYPQCTFSIILGFLLGSVVEIFPGLPSGWEILICVGTLAAGFGAIRLLSRFG